VCEGTRYHHSLLFRSGGVIRKIIEPDFIFRSIEERERLQQRILEYRRLLHSFSIPVAEQYRLRLDQSGLVETTTDCGVDGYELIRQGGNSVLQTNDVVCLIASALVPILEQEKMRVTIDPHPANWCFDGATMRYIDFHPARYQLNGVCLVGFPQPDEGREYRYSLKRYYTKIGILRSLRFSAVRAGGRAMEAALLGFVKEKYPKTLGNYLLAKFAALPEQALRNGGNIHAIIPRLDVWRVDDLREIAMVVADAMGHNEAEEFLSAVLDLTRVDFHVSLAVRSERVEEAKILILRQAATVGVAH
jgi:hypothetical protein